MSLSTSLSGYSVTYPNVECWLAATGGDHGYCFGDLLSGTISQSVGYFLKASKWSWYTAMPETLVEAKWGLPRKTQVNLNPGLNSLLTWHVLSESEDTRVKGKSLSSLQTISMHFTDIILVKMLGPASKCNMQSHWESEIDFLNSPQGFSIPGFRSWGIFFSLATYPHSSHL